mmetsp:Transcript_22441/g.62619  ORF Transcript_22441/g.62619 Transcript_22441/m.62619 type:complete len:258 (-) Transcript_22441:1503-2276(-)
MASPPESVIPPPLGCSHSLYLPTNEATSAEDMAYSGCWRGSAIFWVSGLQQKRHFLVHPCRKTVERIPGPSVVEKLSMEYTLPRTAPCFIPSSLSTSVSFAISASSSTSLRAIVTTLAECMVLAITSSRCSGVRRLNRTAYPLTRMVRLGYFSGWRWASCRTSRFSTLMLRWCPLWLKYPSNTVTRFEERWLMCPRALGRRQKVLEMPSIHLLYGTLATEESDARAPFLSRPCIGLHPGANGSPWRRPSGLAPVALP